MANNILKTPVDHSVTFRPTTIHYIRALRGIDHSEIYDVSTELLHEFDEDFTPAFGASIPTLLSSLQACWRLVRKQRHSNGHMTVVDVHTEETAATWHSPILGYGVSRISFPADSTHGSHQITVRPLSVWHRAQSFVCDSATYVWEVSSGKITQAGRLSLYKLIGSGGSTGKKIDVARYRSDSGKFEVGGCLAMEQREVDVLVATLTLLAVLNQRDAFYMPGLDLSSKKH